MQLKGYYNETVKRDDKTGFTLFYLRDQETQENIFCKGSIHYFAKGTPLKLEGEINDKVFEVKIAIPVTFDETSALSYLINKCRFSEIVAKKIVNITGVDIMSFLEKENAEELLCNRDNKGECINKRSYIKLQDCFSKDRALYELYRKLTEYGISIPIIEKIYNTYGLSSWQEIEKNPYAMIEMGASFYTCDLIGYKSEELFMTHRLNALIKHIITENELKGNTYISINQVIERIKTIVSGTNNQTLYTKGAVILGLLQNEDIKIDHKGRIYRKSLYFMEKQIAKAFYRLEQSSKEINVLEELILSEADNLGITISSEQKNAVGNILKVSGVHFLIGGPGTGKTACIRIIVAVFQALFPEKAITLLAPSGCAAQKMSALTGMMASTIHKGLNIIPTPNGLKKIKYTKIPRGLVIVDETSMADTEIISCLTDACESGSYLLFVGDDAQLESVGPGNVLKDCIDSKCLDINRLTKVFRQGAGSLIIENANRIKSGIAKLQQDSNFQVNVYKTDEDMKLDLMEACHNIYKNTNDIFDIQVLVPVYKKDCGIHFLNKSIQNGLYICNRKDQNVFNYGGDYTIFENDKVILLKNNYEEQYYNGDIGLLKQRIDEGYNVSLSNGTDIMVPNSNLEDIMPAYAISIHKSQGQEYRDIIICLPSTARGLMTKSMLYTAVTRAKQKVKIFAVEGALEKCILTENNRLRNTGLKEMIQNVFSNSDPDEPFLW